VAFGIDVYARYQNVTDWGRVRGAGVRFCIIKASDGGGRAVAPADGLVAGARAAGIPAGLYHYAQLAPTPEAQADVLAAEYRRLGLLQLPPALDLEGDFHPKADATAQQRAAALAHATDFGRRFLLRLQADGHPRVMLYANTGFLAQLRPETWAIPGLLIWAADYGPNDGRRHPDLAPYTGPVAVHQYTDRGAVPGITGTVDLNESLIVLTQQEDTVSWTDDLTGPSGYHAPAAEWLIATSARTENLVLGQLAMRAQLATLVAASTADDLTRDQVEQLLRDEVRDGLARLASDVATAVRQAVDEHGVQLDPTVRDELASAVVTKLGQRLGSTTSPPASGTEA
jgi:GH25 family lysozyme M1 (1,4-beta-N-acetylmuramidase)